MCHGNHCRSAQQRQQHRGLNCTKGCGRGLPSVWQASTTSIQMSLHMIARLEIGFRPWPACGNIEAEAATRSSTGAVAAPCLPAPRASLCPSSLWLLMLNNTHHNHTTTQLYDLTAHSTCEFLSVLTHAHWLPAAAASMLSSKLRHSSPCLSGRPSWVTCCRMSRALQRHKSSIEGIV